MRRLILASFLIFCSTSDVAAQDATAVVAASKAMGVDNLNAIAFIGLARIGAFGQSKSIGDPMSAVNVTNVAEYEHSDGMLAVLLKADVLAAAGTN